MAQRSKPEGKLVMGFNIMKVIDAALDEKSGDEAK